MKTFGDKKEFAITYTSYLEKYADDPDVLNSDNKCNTHKLF